MTTLTQSAPRLVIPGKLLALLHRLGWQQPLAQMRDGDLPSWLAPDCSGHLFVYVAGRDGPPCVLYAAARPGADEQLRLVGTFEQAFEWLRTIQERGCLCASK